MVIIALELTAKYFCSEYKKKRFTSSSAVIQGSIFFSFIGMQGYKEKEKPKSKNPMSPVKQRYQYCQGKGKFYIEIILIGSFSVKFDWRKVQ